jgi:hypothetical protein
MQQPATKTVFITYLNKLGRYLTFKQFYEHNILLISRKVKKREKKSYSRNMQWTPIGLWRAVLLRVYVAMGMLWHSNEHLQISTVSDRLSMFATCGIIPWKAPTYSLQNFLNVLVQIENKMGLQRKLNSRYNMIWIRTLVHSIRKITARISNMSETVPHQRRDLLKRLFEGVLWRCFIALGITVAVSWIIWSGVREKCSKVSWGQ